MDPSITLQHLLKEVPADRRGGPLRPGHRRVVYGVYYSTSSDLIHWSLRQLMMEAELLGRGSAATTTRSPIRSSSTRSTSAELRDDRQEVYLYFTRLNY